MIADDTSSSFFDEAALPKCLRVFEVLHDFSFTFVASFSTKLTQSLANCKKNTQFFIYIFIINKNYLFLPFLNIFTS